ncbi:MAG: N-formylglutamate deformylase [Glaciecola sp.]|jgi:formiminoglutamase
MNNKPLLPIAAFEFTQGDSPLLVSMPHSGLELTPEVEAALSPKARALPDTDWYLPELYDFLPTLGVSCIKANYSRYVIDLNRPIDDIPLYQTTTTGLFPQILFDESPLFLAGKAPNYRLKQAYKTQIWQAYHATIEQELHRLKSKFGYAILFDAHSIAAEVPMLFDGTLPDFNWGTNDGKACSKTLIQALQDKVTPPYSQVTNGRFKGGYITRHFGQPDVGIHAIQLELSQRTYLDEASLRQDKYRLCSAKLGHIRPQLKLLLTGLLMRIGITTSSY